MRNGRLALASLLSCAAACGAFGSDPTGTTLARPNGAPDDGGAIDGGARPDGAAVDGAAAASPCAAAQHALCDDFDEGLDVSSSGRWTTQTQVNASSLSDAHPRSKPMALRVPSAGQDFGFLSRTIDMSAGAGLSCHFWLWFDALPDAGNVAATIVDVEVDTGAASGAGRYDVQVIVGSNRDVKLRPAVEGPAVTDTLSDTPIDENGSLTASWHEVDVDVVPGQHRLSASYDGVPKVFDKLSDVGAAKSATVQLGITQAAGFVVQYDDFYCDAVF